MKRLLLSVALASLAIACSTKPSSQSQVLESAVTDGTILTCDSIDPTFTPSYHLFIKLFNPNWPGCYVLNVSRASGSPIVVAKHYKQGPGSVASDGVANIQLQDGGHLIVTKLENGVLKGDMSIRIDGTQESDVELICNTPEETQVEAGNDGASLKCTSIDPTFTPFYSLTARLFDVTFPGYYSVTLERRSDTTDQLFREGPGSIKGDGTADIQFEGGGHLTVTKLANGVLKGNMSINVLGSLESDVELICQK